MGKPCCCALHGAEKDEKIEHLQGLIDRVMDTHDWLAEGTDEHRQVARMLREDLELP